jgi:hypothetical protein
MNKVKLVKQSPQRSGPSAADRHRRTGESSSGSEQLFVVELEFAGSAVLVKECSQAKSSVTPNGVPNSSLRA